MWKTLRKTFLFGLALFGCAFGFLVSSGNVNAESYPVSSFGLYGQKYYGNANGWQSNLGYSGTTMHSVYRWEVWISNLSQSQTGKYGAVNLSGIINYPPDFDVRTDQGFSITQCYIAGTGATLSNVRTSWALGDRNIIWAAEAQLEFPTNTLSGNMFCTFQSNNGQYFLQHITDGYGQITFGTTNFNATFSNNLSDELLQQQIEQNRRVIALNEQIRDGIGQTTDAINNLKDEQQATNDWLTDDTEPSVDTSDLGNSAGWLPAGPVDSILTLPINLLQGVVNVFTNPDACEDVVLPLPYVDTDINLPCVGPILNKIGITPLWNFAGAIIGAFLIWNTLKWLYKFVDDTLTFRENNSSIWGGL